MVTPKNNADTAKVVEYILNNLLQYPGMTGAELTAERPEDMQLNTVSARITMLKDYGVISAGIPVMSKTGRPTYKLFIKDLDKLPRGLKDKVGLGLGLSEAEKLATPVQVSKPRGNPNFRIPGFAQQQAKKAAEVKWGKPTKAEKAAVATATPMVEPEVAAKAVAEAKKSNVVPIKAADNTIKVIEPAIRLVVNGEGFYLSIARARAAYWQLKELFDPQQ